jgi:hypothetical protein
MLGLSINPLAVVVSALVVFFIGALWYSPLVLGRQWVAAHGYTAEKLVEMRKGATASYAVSFLCYLLMGAVLSVLGGEAGVTTAAGGLRLGALCWLGFAATIGLTANLFSEKPLAAYLIDASYQLVYLAVMGAIVGGWQ